MILELRQLATESHARDLRTRNITPTSGGPETTVTKGLETEQEKEGYSKRNYVIL